MARRQLPEFKFVRKLGEGAYGCVYEAVDEETGQVVAIKRTPTDEDGIPSTTLREISLLKHLNHPNIIRLLGWRERTDRPERSVEMVFDYMKEDLATRSRRGRLQPETVKHVMWQILLAVSHMHQRRVYHRDLKPHNILISQDNEVKVADFGLGRAVGSLYETYSKQIETLWYRAPELLLGVTRYDGGVDIWSVGCIFYELVERDILFQSETEFGQLMEIFRQLGTPRLCEWQGFNKLPNYNNAFPKMRGEGIACRHFCAKGRSLLEAMLRVNPARRIRVEEALSHPYFGTTHE